MMDMSFTLDILRDYTDATPRDLARLRGNKRTILQQLLRTSRIRLEQLKQTENVNQIEIDFHTDSTNFCITNEHRLSDPQLGHIGALTALYRDAKGLNETYKGIEKDLPIEFRELLEEEILPAEDGRLLGMPRKPSVHELEATL